MQETQVRSLNWEDPLEEEVATYSSVLAWEIPSPEKLGGLQSVGYSRKRVRPNLATKQQNDLPPAICATLWTVAHHAPLSLGLSRQEYWIGLSCPPPGDLPNPGTEPAFLTSSALIGRFFPTSATCEAP